VNIRDLLNKYKWANEFDPSKCVIEYLHRENGDMLVKEVNFATCIDVTSSGFAIFLCEGEELSLPYHRIMRVLYDGEVKWKRRRNSK
jgi:uncharacterized protein (UPF0248 family)